MDPEKKRIVLVIEDEDPQLKAITEQFVREEFAVFQAKNGEEGFKMALKEKPDIILLDILMPKMDGMTMLKKLREESAWGKTVPVIVLTNLSPDTQEINQAIAENEPAYYLVKSDISLNELMEKAKEILSS